MASTTAHVFKERINLDSMPDGYLGIEVGVMLEGTPPSLPELPTGCNFSKGRRDGEQLIYLVLDKLNLAW